MLSEPGRMPVKYSESAIDLGAELVLTELIPGEVDTGMHANLMSADVATQFCHEAFTKATTATFKPF